MSNRNAVIETITAQATAPGRGGIAIVRVSGPLVQKIILAICGKPLAPRQAVHTVFLAANGEMLDDGVAIYFPNPNSFTGEDVLELHGHGGPVVVDLLLQRILSLGARLARPGEFSERAFLNGKIDLTQAEAIADLIDASSTQAARLALRSLQGEFSKAIHQLNEKIIHLRMYVEAAIDFSDEEIDFLSDATVRAQWDDMVTMLKHIQAQSKQGSFLREGITAVIAGEPNVGKSSLLNRLSGKEIAIVTDIPGTTRDVLRDHILMDDIPVHIIDTAGLRKSADVVEQEGIRRARAEMDKADVILYVTSCEAHTENSLLEDTTCPIIFIRNKIDLKNESPTMVEENGRTVISLSAKSGAGLDLLKNRIKRLVGFQEQSEGLFLARRRHLDALSRAEHHLMTASTQLHAKSGELAAEDLRLAHTALSEITGEFSADDLLGRIFSSFCIGK